MLELLQIELINIEKKIPIKNSKELASIINEVKKNFNKHKKNPATKTFQAIRIFVNKETNRINTRLNRSSKTFV